MNEERNTDIQDRAELTDKHKTQKKKRKTIDIRRNFPNKKKKEKTTDKVLTRSQKIHSAYVQRSAAAQRRRKWQRKKEERERDERASTERREKRSNKENFSRSSVAYLFVLGHGLWPTGHDPPSMTQHATNGTVCT